MQETKNIAFFLGNYIHDGTNMIVKTDTLYLRVLCKEWILCFAISVSMLGNYNI